MSAHVKIADPEQLGEVDESSYAPTVSSSNAASKSTNGARRSSRSKRDSDTSMKLSTASEKDEDGSILTGSVDGGRRRFAWWFIPAVIAIFF